MIFYSKFVKRLFDVFLSLSAIILLSPILLTVAILIRINLGAPVIFKQKRPGLGEEIFTMYKFRTMNNQKDKKGELLPDSQRLTKFGRLLRSTSLDELPSLFNVVKGDMSIVGPRPLLIKYLPYYKEDEKIRHTVRPGLTGLAQIKGRNNINWDKRLSYDILYVENLSLFFDVKIILRTIFKVFKQEDVIVVDQGKLKDLDIERRDLQY